MKNMVFLTVPVILLFSGCAHTDYGLASYSGVKPLYERYLKLNPDEYRIEILGNGFSNFEMLETHFSLKAKELCAGKVKNEFKERTIRLRNGITKDIRMDCNPGDFCPADDARFPLVRGRVTCASTT